MKKVLKKTLMLVIYMAILAGLVYGIPRGLSYLLKTPYPMASITSGSMWPALKKGDLVFIKGVIDKQDIAIGDIVVYKNQIGFTIHRVIKVNEETVVTKGDANNTSDPLVKYEAIIGKTVSLREGRPLRIPLLGNVSILINKNAKAGK